MLSSSEPPPLPNFNFQAFNSFHSLFLIQPAFSDMPHSGRSGSWILGGRSQKAKQKRLASAIPLFSVVLERRAAGEKAPSSAHREKAKSAFFLANNGVPLRSVCAAGHPRQRRNFYRRQGAFTHGNGISTCHCTRVLPLYLQLAAAVLSPLPYHQCGHDERQRCPVEQPTSRRASPSSP